MLTEAAQLLYATNHLPRRCIVYTFSYLKEHPRVMEEDADAIVHSGGTLMVPILTGGTSPMMPLTACDKCGSCGLGADELNALVRYGRIDVLVAEGIDGTTQ